MKSEQKNIGSLKIATTRNASSSFISTTEFNNYKKSLTMDCRKKETIRSYFSMRDYVHFREKNAVRYWRIEELPTIFPLE